MRPSLLALSLPLLLVACGGASNPAIFDEPGGGADASTTDTSTGGSDTGGGGVDTGGSDTTPVMDTPATGVTLENVCAKLADAYCTPAMADCCTTSGLAWKEAGCRDAVRVACEARVGSVKDGKAVFNPSALTPCQNAWKTLASRCDVPILDYVKNAAFCSQLFVGTVSPGSGCSEDWQCKVAAGAVPDCNSSNRCESTTVSDKDQPCSYAGAVKAVCDYGLACQFSSGATGTCKAAKGLGASCNNSLECGFGFYCERAGGGSSGKCTTGLPLGAGCFNNETCASGSCVGGRCSDPNVSPASNFLCSGSAG